MTHLQHSWKAWFAATLTVLTINALPLINSFIQCSGAGMGTGGCGI